MSTMQRERTTQPYTTSDWDPDSNGPPREPVVALRRLPAGPTYLLEELRSDNKNKKWIFVGRDPSTCDRVLLEPDQEHPTVNRHHCSLVCTPQGRVFVKHTGGTNRTKLNRVRVQQSFIEVGPDDVLRLGKVHLVALSQAALVGGSHQPKTTATTPDDYFRRARAMHADDSKAARALRTPRRTLRSWLDGSRFRQ